MPVADLGAFLRRLRRMFERPGHPSPTDAEVLARFAAEGDEAAFELLVWRHGPAVLGLCRRLLRTEQDAEDAFQAAFLTLARRARSIGRREAVGSWLYKVAFRIALRLRDKTARHAVLPLECQPEPAGQPAAVTDSDTRTALGEEVSRLPDKYRAAVVLCYLEGKTNTEAARELGCPRGTVDSRLAWARERLRRRLLRRGVCLSVAALVSSLTTAPASATPPALVHYTAHLAWLFTTRGTALGVVPSIQLAQGALRAMFFAKMKSVIIVVAALGLLAGGSWGVLRGPAAAKVEAGPPAAGETDSSVPSSAPAESSWDEVAALPCAAPVWCLAFSADGSTLVTGSGATGKSGALAIWEAATARLRIRVETDGPVRGLALSPDGKVVATAQMDNAVRLWDVRTGQAHTALRKRARAVRAVAFSPDGQRIATGDENAVRIWDLDAAADLVTLGEDRAVRAVAFSPDGRRLLSASDDGAVTIWDAETGKKLSAVADKDGDPSAAFSPDGKLLSTATGDGTVRIWDAAVGKEIRRLPGHRPGFVAFAPDGRLLASSGGTPEGDETPGAIVLWELASGKIRATLRGPARPITALAFSPDGKVLACAGGSTVKLWRKAFRVRAAAGNDGLVADRLDQLVDQLLQSNRTDAQVAEALYLAALGRLPTAGEKARFQKVQAAQPDNRRAAFEQLLSALTSSSEFGSHVESLQQRSARRQRE
jgi:RNA polymerase sigma factor (sigma-70 family)